MVKQNNDTSKPELDGFKQCRKCGQVKPNEAFCKRKSSPDGLYYYCKACDKSAQQSYRQANQDEISERRRSARRQSPEKERERDRQRYKANSEKRKAQARQYRTIHNDKVRQKDRERRRTKIEVQPDYESKRHYRRYWSNPEKARLLNRQRVERRRSRKLKVNILQIADIEAILFDTQNGQCMYCGCDLTGNYHLDHIIPLSLVDLLGEHHPGHVPSNLALACPKCNRSKSKALLEDWLSWKYPDQMDEILHRVEAHIAIMQEWEKEEGD